MNDLQTESARLTALKRYDILDTPPDGTFDRITALAAKVFEVPMAIISLVDSHRSWFKSHFGLDAQQIDRVPGLCATAIQSEGVYIVENARKDPRTQANPMVTETFGLVFYAAAPLTTHDGHNLGLFCLIDQKPRTLTDNQKEILQDFARIVMDEIEMRMAVSTLMAEKPRRNSLLEPE